MFKDVIELPVLNTRNVIIYPNHEIVINLLNSQSVATVNYSIDAYERFILITTSDEVSNENVNLDKLNKIGTIAEIKSVKKVNSYYSVTLYGIERVKFSSFKKEDKYIIGCAKLYKLSIGKIQEVNAYIDAIKQELLDLKELNVPKDVLSDLYNEETYKEFPDKFIYFFPVTVKEKLKLLEAKNLVAKYELILLVISQYHFRINIDKTIDNKLHEKSEKDQKEYYLKEKIKIINEELGNKSNLNEEIANIREKVDKNPYPLRTKENILEELDRLEILTSASSEHALLRNYIDWLVKVPWYEVSKENSNLNKASKVLDSEHFGLEKVKERILEYLAVREMTKSLKSPILCLVGPPGIGKTTIAHSIANAINREFVRVSLGGVSDESEIRGHRKTYIGSMPGRIIKGMVQAKVTNPVILLDEIDKMTSNIKGDPASALLEVLDPSQNDKFLDHYLEVEYDLSNVMFIATANSLDTIPYTLLDRLDVIQLSSYTEIEKVSIASKYLIPKTLKANCLKKSHFSISNDVLLHVIRSYTKEAGVRQLEKTLASLIRKTVLAVLKDGKSSVKVTKNLVREWLGIEKFEYNTKENKDQVGVVTGLAYTSYGGDVLPIEVTYYDGKGDFVVTGQLGDVMKESTKIALDYIKSNSKKYKINQDLFTSKDIHIHVPEGAIKKDGPSAGITLTTALVSALTKKKVDSNIAMTGEVTLRGNVLPIGGLKEKSLAALRSGIKTIVIPKGNVKDIEEMEDEVKDNITFIPVESVDEVIDRALL